MPGTSSSAELQRLWKGAEGELAQEIHRAVLEHARHLSSPAAGVRVAAAGDGLRRRLGQLMALADLIGRRRMLLELERLLKGNAAPFNAETVNLVMFDLAATVPSVPFKDAVRDIVRREPRLAATAQQVAEIYQGHGFAAVHAADDAILRRVQAEVASALRDGRSTPDASEIVRNLANWSRAYAETVVRTNLTTAYSAGRFEQLKDPAVRSVVPALRFVSVQEPYDPHTGQGTRPNHAACHGLIAAVDDPVWDKVAPPLGYNCRCTVALVTIGMLEARGLLESNGKVRRAVVPDGGGPDRGFVHAGRPNVGLFGGL